MTSPRNPVLLIHGIDDTAQVFDRMVAHLQGHEWPEVHTINLWPNNGDKGLDQLSLQVQIYVNTKMAHADKIDLVGFSMGGMVGRHYIQRLDGIQRVQRFVTLSSPHQGTWTAYFRNNQGCRQMRPGSAFLRDLNSTLHDLNPVEFTSLWTPYDLMILPAHSSQLPVGQSLQLGVWAHPLMLTSKSALAATAAVLADGND